MIRMQMNVNVLIPSFCLKFYEIFAVYASHRMLTSLDSNIHSPESALHAPPKDHHLVPNFVILPRSKNRVLDHLFLLMIRLYLYN